MEKFTIESPLHIFEHFELISKDGIFVHGSTYAVQAMDGRERCLYKVLENSSLLGSFFETLVLGQLIRNSCNQGLPINLYYFRDNHGNEIDFIVPEGTDVHLYESKWKLQSGITPKNISKFKSIIGKSNIKTINIITSGDTMEQIEKDCFVTNLIDLK